MGNENWLSFTGIRGIQAGREYYTVMCPLKIIPMIFMFDEVELPPDLRAQRTLNKGRVPEMSRYLLENQYSYIFSSITASVDGDVQFKPFAENGAESDAGRLMIPMNARFLINDGQHRRAAIESALKEMPELGDESLSVVFFVDAGLKRSQQMFADLNRHAVRPTQSIGVLYDHRDDLSCLARRIADEVLVFKGMIEFEKSSISTRSNKLHTLSNIYNATKTLLGKAKHGKVKPNEAKLALEFWEHVCKQIPDWQLAATKKISCSELRQEYIHAHGLALQAIAIVGSALIADNPKTWKERLSEIQGIDWARSNSKLWEGRALVSGRLSKAQIHVTLTANAIKKRVGLSLSAKEKEAEQRFRQARKQAA